MSIKDFRILQKLGKNVFYTGEGAYSSVYKVERLADHKQYALKKVKLGNLSQKQLENAVNEVRILASINHPNIVSYKQAFLEGKNLWQASQQISVIMQFANGGDLYQKIVQYKKKKRYFDENEIWNVLIQVTRGLKTLHDLKIFHRDLKSANGIAKLGDMNVSKIAKNGLLYTQTGTPYYASPQVWKDQPYDSKSDIWSFGCVIYEMTTLEPPFKADDMQGLFETVTNGVYPPPPSFYSKELASVIKLMLQQNPSNRPSTQKLLRSSLLIKKSKQLQILESKETNSELLKTIRIPKKLNYLTDRLPQSNYDSIKSSDGLLRDRRNSNNNPTRQRQNTLPRLDGILRYHEDLIRKKERDTNKARQKKLKNNSLEIEGVSKALRNEIKIDLRKQKEEVREYLNRIHGANKNQKYRILNKGLPPVRR